jgi:hypothetical protein
MKTYHVAISLEVAADDKEEAAREAMTKVIDPTMVIEAITELHGHDEEQDWMNQLHRQGRRLLNDDPAWFRA